MFFMINEKKSHKTVEMDQITFFALKFPGGSVPATSKSLQH